jgi:DNA polymerase III alpha subunit
LDIDLDFRPSFTPTDIFKQAIPASMIKKDELVKHPCGYYLQSMPVDELSDLAAIPYADAEDLGYFKIDFLHLSLLDSFSSKEEMRVLMKVMPDWSLLQDAIHVDKLFQLGKHHTLLQQIRPTSVVALADCAALIRPNKRQFLRDYIRDPINTRPLLYRQSVDDKSSFKRSHAIAYALTIVIQLHLIKQGRL